jgi:signal peptidase I
MRTTTVCAALVLTVTLGAQPALRRGDLVRVRPASTGSPATAMVLRVVAVGGDRIRIADDALFVNDAPVTGFSPDFVKRIAQAPERTPALVPEGHCFVMGEQRTIKDISEYWGQHATVSLEAAQ